MYSRDFSLSWLNWLFISFISSISCFSCCDLDWSMSLWLSVATEVHLLSNYSDTASYPACGTSNPQHNCEVLTLSFEILGLDNSTLQFNLCELRGTRPWSVHCFSKFWRASLMGRRAKRKRALENWQIGVIGLWKVVCHSFFVLFKNISRFVLLTFSWATTPCCFG